MNIKLLTLLTIFVIMMGCSPNDADDTANSTTANQQAAEIDFAAQDRAKVQAEAKAQSEADAKAEQQAQNENDAIVGQKWQLVTLEGQDVEMADNQEQAIYFELQEEDNLVMGFSGCNNFNGTYTLEEGMRIRFSQMLSTMKACPDVDVDEQAVLEVFELTDNYTLSDGELSLNVGRRAPLAVFEQQ